MLEWRVSGGVKCGWIYRLEPGIIIIVFTIYVRNTVTYYVNASTFYERSNKHPALRSCYRYALFRISHLQSLNLSVPGEIETAHLNLTNGSKLIRPDETAECAKPLSNCSLVVHCFLLLLRP